MSELWRKSAVELAALVRSREVSATDVVTDALQRLQTVNPAINAVVAQMPDEALQRARDIDAAIARGDDPGALAGVPVTIKVNTDQVGHASTNGLKLQRDLIASEDSPIVSNFQKAGAVIIGRTNTPAFSLRWFTRNQLHGHTRNPRDRSRTPGGSSGGAAAAVTSGIGAIAHGTDIAGSIRYPAYACGVHGLRPTAGRIPAVNASGPDRHIGAQFMAVSGPIARTIGDVRAGFNALANEDLRDPTWTPVPLKLPFAAKRAAFTVAPDGLAVCDEVRAAVLDAAQRLRDAGWQVDEVDCPGLREPARMQAQLWLAEFRRGAAQNLHKEADPDALFVYEQMEQLCPAPGLDDIMDALQQRITWSRTWQLFLQRYPVWLCPVSAELPFPDLLDVESPAAFKRVMEAQLLQIAIPFMSLPGLTVSTDMVGKTPVGVQLVGGRFHDEALLQAGAAIEERGTPASPIDPRE